MGRYLNIENSTKEISYSILMPDLRQVLCKTGNNLGLRSIISRKQADARGMPYLMPKQWAESELYLYSNKEIRDISGKFVGVYLGHTMDSFSEKMIYVSPCMGLMRDIIVEQKRSLFRVNYKGEFFKITPEIALFSKLGYRAKERITGNKYASYQECLSKIEAVAGMEPALLQAALAMVELREICERKQKKSEE